MFITALVGRACLEEIYSNIFTTRTNYIQYPYTIYSRKVRQS